MTFHVRESTMLVNDAEDGLLSSVNDVAIVDVRDMEKMIVVINHVSDDPGQTNGDRSFLDLETPGTNIDTVIEAVDPGVAGDDITITFVDGSAIDEGELTVVGTDFTFAFKTAVTTVLDFEDAVDAYVLAEGDDALIQVKTIGTPANVLATTDDEFGPTNLAAGADGEGAFTIAITSSIDGLNFAPFTTVDETDFGDGNSLAFEVPFTDANGMSKRALQIKATLTELDDATDSFSMVVTGER